MHTHYENLKVARNATQAQIKAAYRKLRSKHHPDRNKDPDATHRMQIINEAWEVLSSPERRKKHDAEIDRQEQFEAFFREMEEKAKEPEPKSRPEPDFAADEEGTVSTEDWEDPEEAAIQRYFELTGAAWMQASRKESTYSKVEPTYRVYRTDFTVGGNVYYYYSCYKGDIVKKWSSVAKDLGAKARSYSSNTLSPRLANQELMDAMMENKGILWSVGEPRGDVTAAFFRKG